MNESDTMLAGPDWDALVAAVCREGETDEAIASLVVELLLAA